MIYIRTFYWLLIFLFFFFSFQKLLLHLIAYLPWIDWSQKVIIKYYCFFNKKVWQQWKTISQKRTYEHTTICILVRYFRKTICNLCRNIFASNLPNTMFLKFSVLSNIINFVNGPKFRLSVLNRLNVKTNVEIIFKKFI